MLRSDLLIIKKLEARFRVKWRWLDTFRTLIVII